MFNTKLTQKGIEATDVSCTGDLPLCHRNLNYFDYDRFV